MRKHAVEKTAETLIFYVREFGSLSLVGAQRPGENFELSTGYPQFFITGEFRSLTLTSEYASNLFSKSFFRLYLYSFALRVMTGQHHHSVL